MGSRDHASLQILKTQTASLQILLSKNIYEPNSVEITSYREKQLYEKRAEGLEIIDNAVQSVKNRRDIEEARSPDKGKQKCRKKQGAEVTRKRVEQHTELRNS